jgi:hypothetical protein
MKYTVQYTEESQAHVECKKMERIIQVLIAVLLVTYWVF